MNRKKIAKTIPTCKKKYLYLLLNKSTNPIESPTAIQGIFAKVSNPHITEASKKYFIFLLLINLEIKNRDNKNIGIKKFSFWTNREPITTVGIVA